MAAGGRPTHERIEPPRVADGTVYRALEKLLVLDGERISYRALDVEQIGSVYETMMGFRLELARGRSLAIKAQTRFGAPTTVSLEELLEVSSGQRGKWLLDHAGRARSARLMAPVRADLAAWRLASGRAADDELVFPKPAGGAWREHDWRTWRRTKFQPAARALELDIRRPYDLRHAAASLWLHEGRSVVEVAAWLGHAPTMTHSTYAHVVEELRDSPRIDAEDAIRAAREHVPAQYLSSASRQGG